MSHSTYIFHIASNHDVEQCQQLKRYTCESLAREGFIHCCDSQQLAGVVSRYYENVNDVQLLSINPDKLDAALILENTVGGTEMFPHIYGPINADAIEHIEPFGLQSTQRLGLFE